MRRVDSPTEFSSALREASSEAQRAFGNGEVVCREAHRKTTGTSRFRYWAIGTAT